MQLRKLALTMLATLAAFSVIVGFAAPASAATNQQASPPASEAVLQVAPVGAAMNQLAGSTVSVVGVSVLLAAPNAVTPRRMDLPWSADLRVWMGVLEGKPKPSMRS
jgi:hypothetical protein